MVRYSSPSRSWVRLLPSLQFHLFFIINSISFIRSELLSKEDPRLFWDFIDIWLNAAADDQSHSAKACVIEILHHARPLLRQPLASLFEFSLILRSASPALVLYRQLAHDSLASFPLQDARAHAEITKLDPLRLGISLKSPGGKCCWVHTSQNLFFDVSQLLSWLQTQTPSVLCYCFFLSFFLFFFQT